ncbi:hypothetical protein HHUSO_G12986 [Huso huso]|uniref:Uncharacterized protein n=1 Tax=Huso huso TaxID=61971 RepID=A0ABR0ZJT7_HUSHU
MDSVGPDNIPGYGRVQDLAEYLTMEEASEIISLWEALDEYDKQRTVYSPGHQACITKGRFRSTKKTVAPGVESTRR